MRTRDIALYALLTALVLLATAVLKIPTFNGYAHLGDALIMAVAVGHSRRAGMVCGAFGTAMADVLGGYFIWAPFSFVIHGLQGYLVGLIANRQSSRLRKILAMTVGGIIMIVLYQTVTLEIYGWAGFITALYGNIAQAIVGVIGGMLFAPVIERAGPVN
ncbi:MAG: ECF transporter S component [Bacillota bacterium]